MTARVPSLDGFVVEGPGGATEFQLTPDPRDAIARAWSQLTVEPRYPDAVGPDASPREHVDGFDPHDADEACRIAALELAAVATRLAPSWARLCCVVEGLGGPAELSVIAEAVGEDGISFPLPSADVEKALDPLNRLREKAEEAFWLLPRQLVVTAARLGGYDRHFYYNDDHDVARPPLLSTAPAKEVLAWGWRATKIPR